MKSDAILEIGALFVCGIFALAIWQKAVAQTAALSPAGVAANRSNAWTSLGYQGGELALGDLQQLFNNNTN